MENHNHILWVEVKVFVFFNKLRGKLSNASQKYKCIQIWSCISFKLIYMYAKWMCFLIIVPHFYNNKLLERIQNLSTKDYLKRMRKYFIYLFYMKLCRTMYKYIWKDLKWKIFSTYLFIHFEFSTMLIHHL